VDGKVKAALEDINKVLWCHCKCPLDEFVQNPAGAQHRGVRGLCKCSTDFFYSNQCEVAWSVRRGVIPKSNGKGQGCARKELGSEGSIHIIGEGQNQAIGFV
jgi:hypothetical protein